MSVLTLRSWARALSGRPDLSDVHRGCPPRMQDHVGKGSQKPDYNRGAIEQRHDNVSGNGREHEEKNEGGEGREPRKRFFV